MRAKILAYALPALVLATIHLAEAQQPKNVPRIGYLVGGDAVIESARSETIRQALCASLTT
jgi:hypothetical protein